MRYVIICDTCAQNSSFCYENVVKKNSFTVFFGSTVDHESKVSL